MSLNLSELKSNGVIWDKKTNIAHDQYTIMKFQAPRMQSTDASTGKQTNNLTQSTCPYFKDCDAL